jgi:hypothetical protein
MEVSGQLHVPTALPPGTHCVRDWVGPKAGLDAVAKGKNSLYSTEDRNQLSKRRQRCDILMLVQLWLLLDRGVSPLFGSLPGAMVLN